MKKSGLYFILVVISLLAFAACTTESDCDSTNASTITIAYFRLNELDPDTSFWEADTIVVGSVTTAGSDVDLIADEDTIFGKITLPVNPTTDTTLFEIGRNDLKVKYDVRQRVLSAECGVELVFSNLDTLSNPYDSLAIISRNLDRNETNFEVYRR